MALTKHILPFVLGMAAGVVFNDQIRQLWGMLRGAVPQVPDIPSFGGGAPAPEIAEDMPADETSARAYAYKADFEREYESHNETVNNGIQWY